MTDTEHKANRLASEIARLEQAMRFARDHAERQRTQHDLQEARVELYYLHQYMGA